MKKLLLKISQLMTDPAPLNFWNVHLNQRVGAVHERLPHVWNIQTTNTEKWTLHLRLIAI